MYFSLSTVGHPDTQTVYTSSVLHCVYKRDIYVFAGSPQVARVVYFSQYYLLTSLPPLYAKQPTPLNELFYGVGRTGLAKGGEGKDYQVTT